jgi:hypothetical protein
MRENPILYSSIFITNTKEIDSWDSKDKYSTCASDSSMVRSTACSYCLYASHILLPWATCKPAAVRALSKISLNLDIPVGEHWCTVGSNSWTKSR